MIKNYTKIDKIDMKKTISRIIEEFNFQTARVSVSYHSDMFSGHTKIIIEMHKDFHASD